jgi:exodeoxyribonuclease VII large subunit
VEASRETVRVDLAPARPRERGAAVRWTSTTEVVRIDTPASTPVVRPERVVLTVTQLTQAVKGVLAEGFRRVLVRGEVSNFRGLHASGHLFFKLKDAGRLHRREDLGQRRPAPPLPARGGDGGRRRGQPRRLREGGQYNLIVQRIEPSGAGALAIAFAQLRDRLTAEGLMGEQRLRPAASAARSCPWRIGVVTSRSGAALHDFLRVLHRRNSRLSVLLCHARVQGPGRRDEVVRALQRLARTDVDVIVVTRGGGSVEDLWTFNEETVARAIAASPVPVVSAVGHEVDFTIADFVADARAPTPSAAAELLAPELEALLDDLRTTRTRLRQAVGSAMAQARERLRQRERRLRDPRQEVTRHRHGLIEQERALGRLWTERLRKERSRLMELRGRLERFRPEALLGERRAPHRAAPVEAGRGAAGPAVDGVGRAGLDAAAPRAARAGPGPCPRPAPAWAPSPPGCGSTASGGCRRRGCRWGRPAPGSPVRCRRASCGRRGGIQMHAGRLDGLSPLRVMARGYAVVYRADDGHLVRRAGEVQPGAAVRLRWAPAGCESLSSCDEAEATITRVKPRARSRWGRVRARCAASTAGHPGRRRRPSRRLQEAHPGGRRYGPVATREEPPSERYSDVVDRLEEVVKKLEGGQLSLEDSLEEFEKGSSW